MPDFSVILQSPQVRALVQENTLERAFHDALFPQLLFRGEATPQPWAAGIGDTQLFTAPGLMPVSMAPLRPGFDPVPQGYSSEQWYAQMQQYAGTIDTHMPSDYVAIASLFLRNAHQLGLQASMSMNRKVRNRMYNSAESGWTVADGAQVGVTALRVKRLNGFTRARNPTLSGGSQVRFDFVSSTNPLGIKVFDTTPAEVPRSVIGFTPDTPGDELGPGTITLSVAVTVSDRAYVISDDRTSLVRVGGGLKVDDVGTSDIPTLSDVRTAVARFRTQNVPRHPDGRYHCHFDPTSEALLFRDAEFQRLNQSIPDYYMYREFAVGEILGTIFVRNNECPLKETVLGGLTAGAIPYMGNTDPGGDDFAGELFNNGASTGVPIHRMLFTSQGGIYEYYSDLQALLTEAGVIGKIAEPRITNNGIEVFSERIQLVIRAPLNRLQDMVSTSWKFMGDWPARTDATTGDTARYKRMEIIQHGE